MNDQSIRKFQKLKNPGIQTKNLKNEKDLKRIFNKNMSTTKKDSVIEALEQYLEQHPSSDAAKLMLYANPSGSGLLGDKPKGLEALKRKIEGLNATGRFNPEGLQLPLAQLGIESRIRHSIDELLNRMEIANLMRAHLYVAHTKGVEWPPKPIIPLGVDPATIRMPPVIKIPTIRAIKTQVKSELVGTLPTLIGIAYTAKYKSSSTFSYNLSETKFYTLNREFLEKALDWVGVRLGLLTASHAPDGSITGHSKAPGNDSDSMFARAVPQGQVEVGRAKLVFDEWIKYTYTKARDSHTYPPSYDKCAKAITSRVGKLFFASPSDDDYQQNGKDIAMQVLGALGMSADILKLKKKEFQLKLYDHLLNGVRAAYAEAANAGYTVGTEAHTQFVYGRISAIIATFASLTGPLSIEKALVCLDVYAKQEPVYTRSDYYNVRALFSQTGICNDRVINAVYKFISTASLLDSPHSRKHIAPSIEAVLAMSGDLSRIKTDNTEEPPVIFSAAALSKMPPAQAERFRNLHDQKAPGATGYVQKGVMAITSSLKTDKDNATVPSGYTADQVRLLANWLDEMANLYALIAEPVFEVRRKELARIESDIKLQKRHGVHVGGGSPHQHQGFVAQTVSPTAQMQQQSMFSTAPVAETVPMFNAPPLHTTNHAHTHHTAPVEQPAGLFAGSPSKTAAPAGLFGNLPSVNVAPKSASPSPKSKAGGGLFGAGSPSQVQSGGLFGAGSPGQKAGGGLFGTGSPNAI